MPKEPSKTIGVLNQQALPSAVFDILVDHLAIRGYTMSTEIEINHYNCRAVLIFADASEPFTDGQLRIDEIINTNIGVPDYRKVKLVIVALSNDLRAEDLQRVFPFKLWLVGIRNFANLPVNTITDASVDSVIESFIDRLLQKLQ